jgi:hypothetical protein
MKKDIIVYVLVESVKYEGQTNVDASTDKKLLMEKAQKLCDNETSIGMMCWIIEAWKSGNKVEETFISK